VSRYDFHWNSSAILAASKSNLSSDLGKAGVIFKIIPISPFALLFLNSLTTKL